MSRFFLILDRTPLGTWPLFYLFIFLPTLLSSWGDPEWELHHQPGLVGAGLPDLWDDTGPVALPQAQGARQAGGGGPTSARGPGGVLRQVLRGGEGHLQTGTVWMRRWRGGFVEICAKHANIFWTTIRKWDKNVIYMFIDFHLLPRENIWLTVY